MASGSRMQRLVAAAVLSNRYVTERFLPDKAIDLVDEAAARLRMETDSMPVALDEVERRSCSWKSSERHFDARRMLPRWSALSESSASSHHSRKSRAGCGPSGARRRTASKGCGGSKEQIERTNVEIEQAERRSDFEAAARLRYSELAELQNRLTTMEAEAREAGAGQLLKEEVSEDDIGEVVARWTGIPVTRLMEGETQKLIQMEERLHERVIGQGEAVSAVSNAIRRSRAGLQDPNRPLGSFIFLGPTGVGKTELARALAEFLFDDERAMIRIDMSEYMEKHSVARLIGAPPGYVGYDEGGQLTESVRRRPYAVVLFDEIEKAHADVFNVLLQVLDDGRLTDGQGRVVDFRNTIIVMTSNLGSVYLMNTELDEEARRQLVMEAVQSHFRPEFLNRVDEMVVFAPLTEDDLLEIVDIQVDSVAKRLGERGLALKVSERARVALAHQGTTCSTARGR